MRSSETILVVHWKKTGSTTLQDPYVQNGVKKMIKVPIHFLEIKEVIKGREMKPSQIVEAINPADVIFEIDAVVSKAVRVLENGLDLLTLNANQKLIVFLNSQTEGEKIIWQFAAYKAAITYSEKDKQSLKTLLGSK